MYELPDGSWDMEREEADFQQAELERLGRRARRLEKQGICTHGSGWTYPHEGVEKGEFLCSKCGRKFTDAEVAAERERLLG